MEWLLGLLDGELVLAVHLLGLANAELFTGGFQDLESDPESVHVVLVEGTFLLKVRLPGLFHVLGGPELEQLEFESLDSRRLSVLALTCAERSWQAHSVIKLRDERHKFGDFGSTFDVLHPSLTNFFFLPLPIVLGAGEHVSVSNLDQGLLALIEADIVLKECVNWVPLIVASSGIKSSLLGDLLSKPD